MKCFKKVLSISIAVVMLMAVVCSLPIVSAADLSTPYDVSTATQLTLESPDNLEADMDAGLDANWLDDNMIKDATVTVSSNSVGKANAGYAKNMWDPESSNEWQVSESGNNDDPAIPEVVADFPAPGRTVKQIVLANCNNYGRYILKAMIVITDNNGQKYYYEATGIDRGGMPMTYTFAEAIDNVVKVDIIATLQGCQDAGALCNGFSYVGILDKRYSFTDQKVYFLKNRPIAPATASASDGLNGLYIPASTATGDVYKLDSIGPYTLRCPRLVKNDYQITLYAKAYSAIPADTTALQIKYKNAIIAEIKGSDFTATGEYVKIAKDWTLGADTLAELKIVYQAGSGAIKLDRLLLGPADSATPAVVQPYVAPSSMPLEDIGASGDEFDPDTGKTWLSANLLKSATVTTNNADISAANLYDDNEGTFWKAKTDADNAASVTADFSALETKPTFKKIILVAPYAYNGDSFDVGSVTSANITVTDVNNTVSTYIATEMPTRGGVTELTFLNAIENVKSIVITSIAKEDGKPGWSEIAILDARYAYERNYFFEFSPANWHNKEFANPIAASETTPAVVASNASLERGGNLIWTPNFEINNGTYRVAVYAKLTDASKLGTNQRLFNVEKFGIGIVDFYGSNFTVAGEYQILTCDFEANGFKNDRLGIWAYNSGFEIAKIEIYSINMSSNLVAPYDADAAIFFGDANSDGGIDVKDLVRTKKLLANKKFAVAADRNKDGVVNAVDLTTLRRQLIGF